MDSSMISKIQKAKRYADEPERVTFEEFRATFKGDHDTYTLTYSHEKGWKCGCHYFGIHGLCSHTMAMERLLSVMVERAVPIELVPERVS
jgi:hypothetical protein